MNSCRRVAPFDLLAAIFPWPKALFFRSAVRAGISGAGPRACTMAEVAEEPQVRVMGSRKVSGLQTLTAAVTELMVRPRLVKDAAALLRQDGSIVLATPNIIVCRPVRRWP